jgi:4-oxalocrotonate tautomerase
MPVVSVQIPEGSFTQEQKRDLVAKVTDVVVEVEGIPELRPAVMVLINEIADGGWGTGGRAPTLDQMKQKYGRVGT